MKYLESVKFWEYFKCVYELVMFELFARNSEFGGTVMGGFFNGFFQLLNCPQFAELLDEEDETVLQYLENITVDEFEDVKSGYKISFVSLDQNQISSFNN